MSCAAENVVSRGKCSLSLANSVRGRHPNHGKIATFILLNAPLDNELAEQKARAKQRLIASRASPLMLVQAGVEIDMEELAGAANKNRGRPPSPQRTRFEMAL